MAKKNPPCVRGLEPFRKSGCPGKSWDGEEGCPCWVSMAVSRRTNPLDKIPESKCIDLWQFDFQWAALGVMEGTQAAIETFRNNMTDIDETGRGVPKPNPAELALFKIVNLQAQRKAIEG